MYFIFVLKDITVRKGLWVSPSPWYKNGYSGLRAWLAGVPCRNQARLVPRGLLLGPTGPVQQHLEQEWGWGAGRVTVAPVGVSAGSWGPLSS